MRHIWHIEEFFTGRVPYEDAKKLLEHLNSFDVHDVSIKIDGSPAVTFGFDDHGAWSSTKSVFNKTPVKYRNTDSEWFEKQAVPVKEAVTQAYHVAGRIHAADPTAGKDVIFIGDYLRACTFSWATANRVRHHSNVIVYDNIEVHRVHAGRNLIMTHSALLPDKSIIHPRRRIKELGVGIYRNAPALPAMPYTVETNLDVNQNVLVIVHILNENPILSDVFTVMIKSGYLDKDTFHDQLRANMRSEMSKRKSKKGKEDVEARYNESNTLLKKVLQSGPVIQDYLSFIRKLIDLKHQMLEDLNTLANNTTGIGCSIKQNGKYISTPHEGFVINIPNTDIRVKLVDINTFTKHNNDDTVYKPWREE